MGKECIPFKNVIINFKSSAIEVSHDQGLIVGGVVDKKWSEQVFLYSHNTGIVNEVGKLQV